MSLLDRSINLNAVIGLLLPPVLPVASDFHGLWLTACVALAALLAAALIQ
jgi:hypothetical protein